MFVKKFGGTVKFCRFSSSGEVEAGKGLRRCVVGLHLGPDSGEKPLHHIGHGPGIDVIVLLGIGLKIVENGFDIVDAV